jgi:hypothetical protein
MKATMLLSLTLLVIAACFSLPACQSTTGSENIVRQFKNNQMISIVFETDSEAVSRLMPASMLIPASNQVVLNIGTFNRSDGSSYHELFIQIPALINDKVNLFIPVSFVDSVEAAKRVYNNDNVLNQAEFKLLFNTKKLDYQVSINGTDIVTAEYTMTNSVPKLDTIDEMAFANPLDSGKVNRFYVTDFKMSKGFNLNGSFTLNLPPPIGVIPIRRMIQARYFECDYNILDNIIQ